MAGDWPVWKSRNPEPELLILNWEALKAVPDTRVEIKFKMASSVIIVLRNFHHSDRDTKDVLTARKSLPLVI